MSDPLSRVERALTTLDGHYTLTDWARLTDEIILALPALIAELKKLRGLHGPSDSAS